MMNHSKSDLYRYAGNCRFSSFIKTYINEPGYRYIFLFRAAKAYKKIPLIGFIIRFLLRICSHRFGIQIPLKTNIAEGFYISHFGPIIINHQATIGKNCNIASDVVIGQVNRGKFTGVPTLGESVWIGSGAKIVGKIMIGNDVLIAPGAFVNFDIPDHSVVIGNPGIIKPQENATQEYINNIV